MDPIHQTPFQTLAIEPRFALQPAEIERAYLAKVASAHPDASGHEDAAADLNHARRTLLNPESRANALLDAFGGPAAADDKSLPDGFLMDIMQTRLEIEEAVAAADADALARWHAWADHERARYTEQSAAAFDNLGSPPAPARLSAIRQTLNAWRYIERLIEQLPDRTS